jgi:hypothetical protein
MRAKVSNKKENTPSTQSKPLYYVRTPEELDTYRKLPPDHKLKRLEEMAKFSWQVKKARKTAG